MGSKICMNASCGATATHEWKRGWPLRSGGYAHLCYSCGSAFENSVYCDTFHLGESGWRECRMCSKRLHCGCIASKSVFELLDYGGVGCTSCVKSSQLHSVQSDELPNGFGSLAINNACKLESSARLENRLVGDGNDGGKLAQLSRRTETNEPCQLEGDDTNSCFGPFREDFMHGIREAGPGFSNVTQPLVGSSKFTRPDNIRSMLEMRDIHGSLAQPSLSMTLGGPSSSRNFVPFSSGAVERRELANAPSSLQQGQKSRPILPKPSKPGFAMSSETNKVVVSEMRIARPPGEGRGKNQLLPRYWPRITDQELQQLSGDLNSTIVPLFEKVLSASDAGRIGRLVLPKACAEAYFPPISQSEGLPLRIQDVKGREWTFQFRFWPNNNSRMYVLEGVTPCIQSMQLQAGDTITFSRIDPGGKLVVGFRKATNNSLDTLDAEASIFPNGSTSGETSFSGTVETLCTDGDVGWNKSESPGARINGDLRSAVTTEKKRTRNIGPKSKRLLMHSEDAMELRLTWEEAQDLLRPPPSAMPSIVTIEDHEIEEYDEPPVFGKKTIFTVRPSGGREQWAQCDDCSKWRKLPLDALLPPKWTCSDNVWDSSRCTCAASQEMSLKDLDNLLRLSKDFKRQKIMESHKPLDEIEPTGLDALASAAVLGESIGDLGETSVGATTKHPRHRAGCSCIVCIQPPSGKGKHKPTCTCNVCLTVKRRFKTLMLRKKKRQSEREAETAQKEINDRKERIVEDSRKGKDEYEMNDTLGRETLHINNPGNEGSQSRNQPVSEISTGQIDLNADPNRDDGHLGAPELSTMNLADAPPNLPFDSYAKQSGIPNLMCEQASLSLRRLSDEAFLASVGWDHESRRG